MASTKKTASSSSSTRKTTTKRKQSSANTRKKTGSRSKGKTQSGGIRLNRRIVGLVLFLPVLLLTLSLFGMSGFLLDPLWKLCCGLLGWGVPAFVFILAVTALLLVSSIQPYRLRVLCLLLIPILWSAIAQCIQIGNDMPLSFSTIIQLWKTGIRMSSAGVISGMVAIGTAAAISLRGAKIFIAILLITCVFVALHRTPWGIARAIYLSIQEERSYQPLDEEDMTVTPRQPKKQKKTPQQSEYEGKKASFWTMRRAKKKQQKAIKAMERAERARAEAEEAERLLGGLPSEPEQFPGDAEKQERSRRSLERKKRLSEVMPQDVPKKKTTASSKKESSYPDIDRLMNWGKEERPEAEQPAKNTPIEPAIEVSAEEDADLLQEMEQKRKTSKAELAAAKKQVEAEIAGAMVQDALPPYLPPSIDLLNKPSRSATDSQEQLEQRAAMLIDTLDSFGIDARLIDAPIVGPTVTRFELQIERGVKISRITALADNIGMALGAANVRISIIPEKGAIGIEVANRRSATVSIREVLGSREFERSRAELPVALGKDITGKPQIIDLAQMPHLMIAGTTGSGKSVCVNTMLVSLLYKFSREELRLIMIDPKIVELSNYNGIPHLLIPVVTDAKKASGALSWAVTEMDRRYSLFAAEGVRKLSDYNELMRRREEEEAAAEAQQASASSDDPDAPPFDIDPPEQTERKPSKVLPKIVIIIDELADLMMVSAKEVEGSICRLAQKARAAGMHLVVATQRPSADVITGLMKSNIPSRIAFAVASGVESRIIMDTTGAEKLLGKGDMFYHPLGTSGPKRIQGCFISTEEIERVIAHVKTTGSVEYSEDVQTHIEQSVEGGNAGGSYDAAEDEDPLLQDAISIVVSSGQASTSLLQRRLKLGYARAARVMDQMEERGIVGPSEGSKPRRVLITKDEWMEIQLRREI